LDFIAKTQQHILKIDNHFENELDIIDRQCKIFCEELYSQIELLKNSQTVALGYF
jgi:hypothetical protein